MTVSTLSVVRHRLTKNGAVVHVLTGGRQGPEGPAGPMGSSNVAESTHAATSKATPVDADEMPLADSAAAFGLKKLTWANLKATLKAYFDTVYQPLATALASWSSVTRASGFDTFAVNPSSANLRSLLTDKTGSGSAVFGTSPTIATPTFTGAATGVKFFADGNDDATTGFDLFSSTPGAYGVFRNSTSLYVKGVSFIDLLISNSPVLRVSSTAATLFQKLTLSSGQIAFPATQVPSADPNTLDDYEEGDWTAALSPLGGGSITLSASGMTYTKKGREVTVTGNIVVSSVSTPTGQLRITGLPFTAGTGAKFNAAVNVYANGLAAGATAAVSGFVVNAAAQIALFKYASGSAADLSADVQAGTTFNISATYFV